MNKFAHISDAQLAFQIKNGEEHAFREIFERYSPKIFQFALKFLKNEADAEELVQIVFLIIWEKRELIDSNQNVKAYIFKIAVNSIYDYFRRKNMERAFSEYATLNFTWSSDFTWRQVIFDDMEANLEKMVNRLPEQRRKIFLMSKKSGLTNNEIAFQLNLSRRTVENQLYRAISYLKEHFKNELLLTLLFCFPVTH